MPAASFFLPLWDRAAEWHRRLAMIRDARQFIYLSTFYIEWDAYGQTLLDALDDAQGRGVQVNLLVDGYGQILGGVLMTAPQRRELSRRLAGLRAGGGIVTFYRPRGLVQRSIGGGQHVKIQVADTGEAIFGSSNITRTSFEDWNEYCVALRGPVVRTLLAGFPDIGGPLRQEHLEALAALGGDPAEADHLLDYWLCNPNLLQGRLGPLRWRGENEVTERMIAMCDAACTSLAITAFYFKPVPRLLAAVLRAAGRGVRVEVFHSHRTALPATALAWIAAAANYGHLLQAGVVIRENRRGEHSKIVLVDEAWVAFGSYNFEDAAHDRLAEAMLASRDPRAVMPARAILDELRGAPENVLVTPESFAALPLGLRLRIAALGPFKWWM